jgi:hypothetical protein
MGLLQNRRLLAKSSLDPLHRSPVFRAGRMFLTSVRMAFSCKAAGDWEMK